MFFHTFIRSRPCGVTSKRIEAIEVQTEAIRDRAAVKIDFNKFMAINESKRSQSISWIIFKVL